MNGRKSIVLWVILFIMSVLSAGVSIHTFNNSRLTVLAVATPVSWGTSGERVRQVQQRLKELGFYSGNVDGVFGTQTFEAIRNFQQANGLTADGIAGEATFSRLGITYDTEQTDEEYERNLRILASAIHGEGRGEPYEGQVAIGAVILNRVKSPDFPNTIADVVYQNGAFDAVRDGQISLTPNESAYRAARDALNGWDPSEGSLYYWNPATATSKWIWSVPIKKTIGRHVFGSK